MRITAEKARRSLYIAAGAFLMIWLLLFGGNQIVSHAAQVTAIDNANVRSQASTDSEVVGSVTSGTSLSTSGETTGSDGKVWYQVTVGGQTGYIRSDLVSSASSNMTQEEVERENSYTETSATVSDTDVTKATVTESSVNVRKGPSSTDARVTGLKAGAVVEVTGEAVGADGKKWYQVNADGKSGFIRADLVEPDSGSEEEEASEGSEEEAPEEEPSEEGSEESPDVSEGGTEISNVISSKIIPGDVDLEDMTIDEATLSEWASGNYYVLYTKEEDGGDGWYLYSVKDGQIERIQNLYGDDEESGDGGSFSSLFQGSSRIVIMIVIVLFVVLILICVMLALKLHEYREYGYDDDDEDDDEDDEDDEDDDDEDDEDDDDDEDEDDDEDDEDDEDDDDDERPLKKRRWSPKNFLARHDDDDEDDDEDEDEDEDDDDDDDDDDEEEEYLDDDDFGFEFLNMDDKSRF